MLFLAAKFVQKIIRS